MHNTGMAAEREPRPLRALRRERLLTSQELARRAGVSPATVWRIEAGRSALPHVRVMAAIARALEVAPGEVAEFRRG